MSGARDVSSTCFLVDNGSLRASATLLLRSIALRLSERIGRRVEPVSLLHSSAVPLDDLGGVAAEIVEPALRARHAAGVRRVDILPLFFGPSAALTDYLPRRVAMLRRDLPGLEVRIARCLVDTSDGPPTPVARALAERVEAVLASIAAPRPFVIVVDHGSPQPAVAAIRDFVAGGLEALLGARVAGVRAASMERREGPEYDFNEPLLERALAEAAVGRRDIVVALLFFSPGRHAGAGGDIERICAEAAAVSGARIHLTEALGGHPLILDALEARHRALVGGSAG